MFPFCGTIYSGTKTLIKCKLQVKNNLINLHNDSVQVPVMQIVEQPSVSQLCDNEEFIEDTNVPMEVDDNDLNSDKNDTDERSNDESKNNQNASKDSEDDKLCISDVNDPDKLISNKNTSPSYRSYQKIL